MNRYIASIIFLIFALSGFSQNSAFTIFDSKGKKVSFEKMANAALKKDYVFFGEYHNDPIAHWLQLELLHYLYKYHPQIIIGAEMFERDNDTLIQQYLANQLTDKQFEDSCRLWSNYKTDYKPVLLFAKENKLSFRATNIPRRYASQLYKKGRVSLDSLSQEEKSWIAPLDFPVDTTLSQYENLLKGFAHGGLSFVSAQAIKDATMGYFTGKYYQPGSIFYHLNGSYHSDFHQGILWYLNYYFKVPYERMFTISTVSQKNINKLEKEYLGKADFIICTPENMTKTH
ncbi:MAG: ChaN family lipoprotein [Flavobacteriia bacterium]|nr:ChaN family lipoprotein [Flavobacteriia bacterium]